jgi:hypothetical protein
MAPRVQWGVWRARRGATVSFASHGSRHNRMTTAADVCVCVCACYRGASPLATCGRGCGATVGSGRFKRADRAGHADGLVADMSKQARRERGAKRV